MQQLLLLRAAEVPARPRTVDVKPVQELSTADEKVTVDFRPQPERKSPKPPRPAGPRLRKLAEILFSYRDSSTAIDDALLDKIVRSCLPDINGLGIINDPFRRFAEAMQDINKQVGKRIRV